MAALSRSGLDRRAKSHRELAWEFCSSIKSNMRKCSSARRSQSRSRSASSSKSKIAEATRRRSSRESLGSSATISEALMTNQTNRNRMNSQTDPLDRLLPIAPRKAAWPRRCSWLYAVGTTLLYGVDPASSRSRGTTTPKALKLACCPHSLVGFPRNFAFYAWRAVASAKAGRSSHSLHCISAAPAALDRYLHGVTGHVTRPSRSIRERAA